MPTTPLIRPRVFIDSDVFFAGSASPNEYSASLVILRMAEIMLLEAIVSQQVIIETERNLAAKMPNALPSFRLLVGRCLTIVPSPSVAEVAPHRGLADSKDLPILAAAVQARCAWLVTFNTRHFQPGHPDVMVLRPGGLLLRVRDLLAHL